MPREGKAAGDELWDDKGAEAWRSSEQSGLAGGFSILAHYFPTSLASLPSRTLSIDYFKVREENRDIAVPGAGASKRVQRADGDVRVIQSPGGTLNCEWPRA